MGFWVHRGFSLQWLWHPSIMGGERFTFVGECHVGIWSSASVFGEHACWSGLRVSSAIVERIFAAQFCQLLLIAANFA